MRFLKAGRLGRRRFLLSLLAVTIAAPVARLIQIRREDFIHRDGWILRKEDIA